MKFSEQLQQIMVHFGLSTTELADKISVPKATISHLMSERNKPSLEFIMKLHTRFPSLNLEWLIYEKAPFLITDQGSEKTPVPALPSFDFGGEKIIEKDAVPETDQPSFAAAEKNPEKNMLIAENPLSSVVETSADIESIIVFYSDGSFKRYTQQ
ncbi:MAG TPA: helix-turn-helix transcriptional regulator [Flavobacterium sp.]|nr:helix-turn-helix transcriptional regulator [Flavobacterium sp.]